MSDLKVARDKGCEYLLSQIHDDGSFGDGMLSDYYNCLLYTSDAADE